MLLERIGRLRFDIKRIPPPKHLSVPVDRHQLENAFKEGGELTIFAAPFSPAAFALYMADELDLDSLVSVSVQGTGCGISEKDLNKVIEPFYTTKDIGEGPGSGLGMVYGFALQSDDFVDVSSTVGKGITIPLCLPIVQEEEAQSHPMAPPAALKYSGLQVLLLEDNAPRCTMVSRILKQMNMIVTEASRGEEAITAFVQNGPFDLTLADVLLPHHSTGSKQR